MIERLQDLPSDALGALVAESEEAGVRFVRRLLDEWTRGANRFDRPGEALFAARVAGASSVCAGSTSTRMPPMHASAECDTSTSCWSSGAAEWAGTWSQR